MKNSLIFLIFCLTTNIIAQESLNLVEVGSHNTGSVDYNDVWGYSHNDKEILVYGARDKIAIIDVTDCSNPIEEEVITDGNTTIWRDFKDYGDYIYGVCDQGSEGLEIINKDDYTWTQNTADFSKAHNIFVDQENARLYVVGFSGQGTTKAMIIYDLSSTPEDPELLATINFNDFDDGNSTSNWYIHDAYVRDNIAYCSHGYSDYAIWDLNDVNNPILLGTSSADGLNSYNHSSWITEDLQYAYIAEEVPQKEITILDISDVTDIQYLGQFSDPLLPNAPTPPRAHNPFIRADLLYISYYHDGVKVYDISDPLKPVIEAYFDTADDTEHSNYSSYIGAWGIYPYLPNGCIGVSDIEDGLILLEHEVETTSTIGDSDLLFDNSSTGLIFRKNPEDYVRLISGPDGEIVVESLTGIPANHENLKRSNLYIDNSTKGLVYTTLLGKNFRMQVNDSGNITNTYIEGIAPTPNLNAQSRNVIINSVGSSLIMKSPDGTCWRINIDMNNTLESETVDCPN